MKKKMLFVIPICTVALIGAFAVSIYAATVNNKLDLDLTANSGSQVTNISDQAAAKGEYDKEIQKIAGTYKNAGKIISDEQIQKLNELYVSQKVDPTSGRLWYEESWKSPLRREWLFIAVSAPQQILFTGLVSIVSMCSRAVYGQICGQTNSTRLTTQTQLF